MAGTLNSRLAAVVVAGFAGLAAPLPSQAGEFVVVELFTSQSCYSCPPAEAYLGELAVDPRIVALEWHVDYWDDLVYGAAGRWKDPYSSAEFTLRQGDYNRQIRQTSGVYTPQMVIDGTFEAVGSRRGDVEPLISQAIDSQKPATATFGQLPDGALSVQVDGEADARQGVWLVRFVEARTTEVLRGENHGKELTNHHVAVDLEKLGEWQQGPASFAFSAPESGMGCAVLIQDARNGRVSGAGLCPPGRSSEPNSN